MNMSIFDSMGSQRLNYNWLVSVWVLVYLAVALPGSIVAGVDESIDYSSYIHQITALNLDEPRDIAQRGDVLFVAAGSGQMFDVSDSRHPVLIGELLSTRDRARVMKIVADYLYVGSNYGITLFDISDERAPLFISHIGGQFGGLDFVVDEGFVYALEIARVVILDFKDLEHPIYVKRIAVGVVTDIAKIGPILYTCWGAQSSRIWRIDVSDPYTAVRGDPLPTTGNGASYASDIKVRGNTAYFLSPGRQVQMADVSDPRDPVWLGWSNHGGFGWEMSFSGDNAYTYSGDNPTTFYEMSDDTSFQRLFTMPIYAYRIAVDGGIGYFVDYYSRMVVVDFSSRENAPGLVGRFQVDSGWSWASDGQNLVGVYGTNLNSYQISDTQEASLVSSLPLPTHYGQMTRSPSHVFVALAALDEPEIMVYEIDELGMLSAVGHFPFAGPVSGLHFVHYEQDLLFVMTRDSQARLEVYDVSNPELPLLMSVMSDFGRRSSIGEMSRYDDVIYLLSSPMAMIDISDLSNPTALEIDRDWPSFRDVAFGVHFVVGIDRRKVYVVGLPHLGPSSVLGSCVLPANAETVTVVGNYAYVDTETGLQVIDITEPESPKLAGYLAGDSPGELRPVGPYLYRRAGVNSFDVLRRQSDEFGEPRVVEIDVMPHQDDNFLNCKRNAKGLLSVVVLTTDDFDATNVDQTTVLLGADEAKAAHTKRYQRKRHEKDMDGDGDLDLIIHFRYDEIGVKCGDTELTLTGSTFEGELFIGTDTIVTEDKKKNEGGVGPEIVISPNPFNPQTTIKFMVAQAQRVTVAVYDIRGRNINDLTNQIYEVGEHSLVWRGCDSEGRSVPSGQYFFRIKSDAGVQIKKALLLK